MSSSPRRPRKTSSPAAADFSRAIFRQLSDRLRGHRATQRGAFRGRRAATLRAGARVAGDRPRALAGGSTRRRRVRARSARRLACARVRRRAWRHRAGCDSRAARAPASDRLALGDVGELRVASKIRRARAGGRRAWLVVEDLDVADALAGEEEPPRRRRRRRRAATTPAAYITTERRRTRRPTRRPRRAPTDERGQRPTVPGKPPHGSPQASLLADTARRDRPRQGRPRARLDAARATIARAVDSGRARDGARRTRKSRAPALARATGGSDAPSATTTSGSRRARGRPRARARVEFRREARGRPGAADTPTRAVGYAHGPRQDLPQRRRALPAPHRRARVATTAPTRVRRTSPRRTRARDVRVPRVRSTTRGSTSAANDTTPRSPERVPSTCSARSPAPPSARVRGASSLPPRARSTPARVPSPRTVGVRPSDTRTCSPPPTVPPASPPPLPSETPPSSPPTRSTRTCAPCPWSLNPQRTAIGWGAFTAKNWRARWTFGRASLLRRRGRGTPPGRAPHQLPRRSRGGTTHAIGGLSLHDFVLAAKLDAVARPTRHVFPPRNAPPWRVRRDPTRTGTRCDVTRI